MNTAFFLQKPYYLLKLFVSKVKTPVFISDDLKVLKERCLFETQALVNFVCCFFISPLAYVDPVHCNMAHLFVELLKDSLNEYAYAAEIAGVNYKLENTMYGIYVSDCLSVLTETHRCQFNLIPKVFHLPALPVGFR